MVRSLSAALLTRLLLKSIDAIAEPSRKLAGGAGLISLVEDGTPVAGAQGSERAGNIEYASHGSWRVSTSIVKGRSGSTASLRSVSIATNGV